MARSPLIVACAVLVSLSVAGSGPAQAAAAAGSPGGGPPIRVLDRDPAGLPTWLEGDLGTLEPGARGPAAARFLAAFARRQLGATGREELRAFRVREDEHGQVHVRIQEFLRGLPVIGADLLIHADAATGRVHTVSGRFTPDRDLPALPALDGETALERASHEAGILWGEALAPPRLVYVIGALGDRTYLAWSAPVRYQSEGEEGLDLLFADALTGALVANHPQTYSARFRRTYTANHGTSLPGTLLILEGGSSGDAVAQTAHVNAGKTYDYYWTVLGRDSFDNAGLVIKTTVHYASNYVNAHWSDGLKQTYYGDGDGFLSAPLGNALDIVAHEFTHGVTYFESQLTYANESGALNESLSDCGGAAVENWADGGIVSADTWKVGEDVWTPGVAGDALRYLNDPAADGSSADFYDDRYPSVATPAKSNDYGWVHSNSGIPNLAFYLISQGGSHPRGKTAFSVPGIGISKARHVYYNANRDHLVSFAGLIAMATATENAAAALYGATSAEVRSVQAAWCVMGIPGCMQTTVSGPAEACAGGSVTLSAAPQIKGGCPLAGCSYRWAYRWCDNISCPSTFTDLPDTGSTITKPIHQADKYVEFRATVTCGTSCGRNGQLAASGVRKVLGPANSACGGGGGPV